MHYAKSLKKKNEVEALKQGQLAWMKERDEKCSRMEGDTSVMKISCASDMNIERTNFLRDRLRECNTSGCLASQLK